MDDPYIELSPQEVIETIQRKQKEHEEKILKERPTPKIKIFSEDIHNEFLIEERISNFLQGHKLLALSTLIHENIIKITIAYE